MSFRIFGRHLGVMFLTTVLAVALAGCGGGSGFGSLGSSPGGASSSGGSSGGGSSGVSEVLAGFGIEVAGAPVSTGNPITATSPGTAQVTLMDAGHNPVPNKVVAFSLSSAVGSLPSSPATALTDSSGNAQVQVRAGTTPGAGTLTATYTDTSGQQITARQSFAVQLSASGEPSLTIPNLEDASGNPVGTTANPITDAKPATVSVILEDSGGNPLPTS